MSRKMEITRRIFKVIGIGSLGTVFVASVLSAIVLTLGLFVFLGVLVFYYVFRLLVWMFL